MDRRRTEEEMVTRLQGALGDALRAVVLWGPETHDDAYRVGAANLMIVLADLEPATLRRTATPIHWWLRKGQAWPRLFSPQLLRDAVDVYPIELLDISRHHRVLVGADPLADITIDRTALRHQCERELREKMMRLREGYIEASGRAAQLRGLLAVSYAPFVQVLRAFLYLLGGEVVRHDRDVVVALCAHLDVDAAAFGPPERMARGDADFDAELAFDRYYRALSQVVDRIDRFVKGSTP